MTGKQLPREITELEALLLILQVSKIEAAMKAGIGRRTQYRWWTGEHSPSVERAHAMRVAIIQLADAAGTITRKTRRAIRLATCQHVIDEIDEVLCYER